MTKIRVLVFLITLIIVGGVGYVTTLYARGYRFDTKSLRFQASGILVVKSDPDGAQVFVNGELANATNTTIALAPATYDVEIKKEGYQPWQKRLVIEKEVVTEANASLFKSAASLSPVTLEGAINPVASDNNSKIAFSQNEGLWVLETVNLPLGFVRDPKRIADGNFIDGAVWEFSPDGSEILLTSLNGVFLLPSGEFTPQNQRVNVFSKKREILLSWDEEGQIKLSAKLRNLPEELQDILNRKASSVVFSPDENKILYTASGSATLGENLIKQLPGASTQKQERTIRERQTYVYDIKEDRNFLIDELEVALRWFPTSQHLIVAKEGQISIIDYDGTNRQVIYSGSYVDPHAYPFINTSKLLILTNLGASDSAPNLYSLTIK